MDCTVDGFFSYYNETNPDPSAWTACDPLPNGRPSARDCWSSGCGSDGSFSDNTCTSGDAVYQHGPGEGLADVVEACAMDAVGKENFLLWWPFVYCFEGVKLSSALPSYAYGTPVDQAVYEQTFGVPGYSFEAAINFTMASAEECATLTGMNWTFVQTCADPTIDSDGQMALGARGQALEVENALATARLDPPHWYTPWIVFEGSPVWLNDDDAWGGSFTSNNQLLNWICAAYDGDLPPGCPKNPSPIPSKFDTGPPPTQQPSAPPAV